MKRPVYLVDFKVVVNEKTWYFMKVKVFMKKKNARMFIKEKNSHEGRNFNSFHIFLGGNFWDFFFSKCAPSLKLSTHVRLK